MKRVLLFVLAACLSFGMLADDAEARRFGGGRSFGRQSYSRPASPSGAPNRSPANSPAASGRRPFGGGWMGPLGGFLAGGLLASLFMGGGMGGMGGGIGLMDILLIGGIGVAMLFIFRNMRRGSPQPMQYAGYGSQAPPVPPVYNDAPGQMGYGGAATADYSSRPAGFDEQAFLRTAKSTFIRLQAANDARDLSDIRQYTTPEVYAEVSMQLQETPNEPQHTEVVTLNAELVDASTEGDLAVAGVRLSGLIREEANGTADPFTEIWTFQRPANQPNAPWLIAGIQQAG